MLTFLRLFADVYMFCLAAFLCIMLFGCAPLPQVDAQLTPYLERFQTQVGADVSNISAEMGDLPLNDAGLQTDGFCVRETSTIQIDRSWFQKTSDLEHEEVVFHELGHCVLHLEHISDLDSQNCPVSIMNPYVMNEACYQKNRTALIDQFINIWVAENYNNSH